MRASTRKVLKKVRIEMEMTLAQLGKKVDKSAKTICNYEAGTTEPDITTFNKICRALNLDPKELI